MKLRTPLIIGVALATILGAGSIAAPANAAQSTAATAVDTSAATPSDTFVVDPSTAEASGDATFYPLPKSAEDSLIVMPDMAAEVGIKPGFVNPKDEARVRTALAAANDQQAKAPTITMATNATVSPMVSYNVDFTLLPLQQINSQWKSGYIGFTADSRKIYNFAINQGGGKVAFQGLGYYKGYNGSDFGLWSRYYLVNSGTSGTKSVPWGNVSGRPAAIIKDTTPYYCIGRWS